MDEHMSNISTFYDGEVMWTRIEGVYGWYDEEFTHSQTLVMKPQTMIDLVRMWRDALKQNRYLRECSKQIEEEIGDISFNEF